MVVKPRRKGALQFLLVFIILGLMGVAGYYVVKVAIAHLTEEEEADGWRIEITRDSVNVRTNHTSLDAKLGEARRGEVYKVLDIYLEDTRFVWYKIEYRDNRRAWLASDRNEPYVKEINNPNAEDEKTHAVDYTYPTLRFFTEEHITQNITTISYGHLDIIANSEYTVKHTVYVEQCRDRTQYWIEYKVTNASGLTTKKLQKISFHEPPTNTKVPSLSEVRSKICTT